MNRAVQQLYPVDQFEKMSKLYHGLDQSFKIRCSSRSDRKKDSVQNNFGTKLFLYSF